MDESFAHGFMAHPSMDGWFIHPFVQIIPPAGVQTGTDLLRKIPLTPEAQFAEN